MNRVNCLFNRCTLNLIIATGLHFFCPSAYAINYTSPVNTAMNNIQSGDDVTIADATKSTYGEYGIFIDDNNPINLSDTGSINVVFNNSGEINPYVRGIGFDKSDNNLGAGTTVTIYGMGKTSSAVGVNVGAGSLKASDFAINVTTETSKAMGIHSNQDYGRKDMDLGSGGTINVVSAGGKATGINLLSSKTDVSTLVAQGLYINVESKDTAFGIRVPSGNNVDLGEGAVINVRSESGGAGIYISGDTTSQFKAVNVHVDARGDNVHAFDSLGGITNLDSVSVQSNNSIGIYASNITNIAATPTMNISASTISGKENSIYSEGDGTSISVNNSAMSSQGTTLVSQSQSIINLSGNSSVLSTTGKAMDASGGTISGSGRMGIYGSLLSENNGLIDLNITNGSVLKGVAQSQGDGVINLLLSKGSTWFSGGNSTVTNLNLDNSTLIISDGNSTSVVGNDITVTGDYNGNNGKIVFNSVLGNDNSVTDNLVVNGNTSGNTKVMVNNLGGQGGHTINGIEIISVDGISAGEFIQDGRIVAGAYDYSLVRGLGDNSNNWYLVNGGKPVSQPAARPEGGSYIENLAAANSLFNTTLHDRLGETQYIEALTGEKKVTSLWLRQVGSHNSWRDSSGQLKNQSNSYVVQLGGDLVQWSSDGLNRGHLGLMAGYGNNYSSTHSSVTDYSSKGSVNGYSVGTYGTWFANDADKLGLFADSWLQYSWFNNYVNGQDLIGETYKSKGLTASVETGYTVKMGEFAGSHGIFKQWFIQPQAQVTWMGVKADDHREVNGTRVSGDGDGNVQTRLGLRTYLKSHHVIDEGKEREFEPFIEASWLHNTRSFSTTMDGARISQAGARNIGEVKVGVEGQINPRVNLWGNIGAQIGGKGYADTSAILGIKYNF